jgi:hypothetical protein
LLARLNEPEPFVDVSGDLCEDIVNQTKTCDNQFVSVHRVPPQFFESVSEESKHDEPLFWQLVVAHLLGSTARSGREVISY